MAAVEANAEGYLRDKKKFQRLKRESTYFPFYAELSNDGDEWLQCIKTGLSHSTCGYAADSEIAFWMNQLTCYLSAFNLRISKTDHIAFTEFFHSVFVEPDYDHRLIHKACSTLKTLCLNFALQREDLELPWRPAYELYKETVYGKNQRCIDKSILRDTILCFKKLFPLTATKEILDEIRCYIDVWNESAMQRFIKLFTTMVPFQMTIEEHSKYGASLWLDELWHFYEMVEINNTGWERSFQFVFSGMAKYCPGYVDWSGKYTVIFSKVLRSLDLSVRGGKVAVGGLAEGSEQNGAEWIVWMLGGTDDRAEKHLQRLVQCVESFLHPLHEGSHTTTLQSFLSSMVSEMIRRVRIERVCRKKKIIVPEKLKLSDRNIESFVSTVLPSVLYAAFSTIDTKTPSQIIRNLAFLAPNLVIPKVLDIVYRSLSTVTEPNRLQHSLDCLIAVCVPLVRDDGGRTYPTFSTCERDWITEYDDHVGIKESAESTESQSRSDTGSSEDDNERLMSDRTPLRRHAVTLIAALVDMLDINDVNKLSLAFRALESFFTLIPIVDCSSALKSNHCKEMSQEEKLLCESTGKLPAIIERFIERIFKLISQLDIEVPKDSASSLDSISDASRTTAVGNDEVLIDRHIQGVLHALLTNASSTVVELVTQRTINFVKHSQFENTVAVEAVCVLVQECTYANPEKYFPAFLTHVCKNLDQLITKEVKEASDAEATVMWFICLGMMLFAVPGQLLLKHSQHCIQLHTTVISMKCATAYRMACWSLKNVLTQLAEIYPQMEAERHRDLDLSFQLSLPIRKWGAPIQKDKITVRWHVPSEAEMRMAQNILDLFVHPEIERLRQPKTVDKHSMKKALYIVEKLISCVGRLVPEFDTAVLLSSDADASLNVKELYNGPPTMTLTIGGENVREAIRRCLHNLIDYLLGKRDDEWKNFQWIAYIQYFLTTNASSSQFRAERSSSGLNYQDPIKGKRADLYRSFEKRIFAHRKSIRSRSPLFTESHLAIMKDLVKLGTNVYTAVRKSAQSYLNAILTRFPEAKTRIVDDIVAYLNPSVQTASNSEKKGAMYMLITGGFMTSHDMTVRGICWPAVTKIDCSDNQLLIKLVFAATAIVSTMSWRTANNVTSNSLRLKTREIWKVKDLRVSSKICDREEAKLNNESRTIFEEQLTLEHGQISRLRSQLVEVCKNEGQHYHWRNVDAARTLLFTLHKYHFDVDAMEVFLQMLHDGRALWRRVAASCIAGWMEWNKIVFVKPTWNTPQKVLNEHEPWACGLRVDNLCLAYDRKTIPVTKDAWDKTIFISKPHWGAYQWPRQLIRSTSSDEQARTLIAHRHSSPIGEAIIATMRNKEFFQAWHKHMLKEKQDSDVYYTSEYLTIKYLFRNHFTEMLPVMKRTMTDVMRGNQRGEQRVAAVYFAGLVRGSRNWPFDDLNRMWKWLKPLLVALIEGIRSDAIDHWEGSLKLVLENVDMRKLHWLVETIFEVSSKPSPTAFHTCARFMLMRYVTSCGGWRSTELQSRSALLAQQHIDVAGLETERTQIACLMAFPAVYRRLQGSMENLPKPFRIMDVDDVVKMFIKEAKPLIERMREQSLHGKSKSESGIIIEDCPRYTKSSEDASMILLPSKELLYMKTLMKFLTAYYSSAVTAFTDSVIAIIPLLAQLANEETARRIGDETRDVDLAVDSSDLLLQMLAGMFLNDDIADSVLNRVKLTVMDASNWRVLVSMMRFTQVFVFCNVFVLEKHNRPVVIRELVSLALMHDRAEVRSEASDCLTSLIHCGHQPVDNQFTDSLFEKANETQLSLRHGAILGLSAVICAFPFTIPTRVIDVVIRFCKYGNSKDSIIRTTVTNTLRSFLNTHRDKLADHCDKGVYKPLVDAVHSVVSPNYYV